MSLTRITAGRLVDGTGAPPFADAAILIDGERIVAVGPAAEVPSPDGAQTFDFPDNTLIPGLVDCHSHLNLPGDGTSIEGAAADGDDLALLRSAENARATLLSGVTTLRDNGAMNRTTFSIKEALRRKIITGPRLSISGRPITMGSSGYTTMAATASASASPTPRLIWCACRTPSMPGLPPRWAAAS